MHHPCHTIFPQNKYHQKYHGMNQGGDNDDNRDTTTGSMAIDNCGGDGIGLGGGAYKKKGIPEATELL